MRFGDLTPGLLVRIGGTDPETGLPAPVPPAMKILSPPVACPVGCGALEVLARDVDTGRSWLFHRLPHRPVTLITPAHPATTEEATT
ncbi:hypothetical protein GCM10017673_14530 [Streptosporangium violaceochromogenes]|nr:hypothetical protein GCM10017673_14530 [Streptosporangium violaceochromogenes]